MSVEAILMHFETMFACEIWLIVQAFHVVLFKRVSNVTTKELTTISTPRKVSSGDGIKINSYKKQRLILIQISFHWICLAKRTLQKFESRRLVGNGRYSHDIRRINRGGGLAQWFGRRITGQRVPGSSPGRCSVRCGLEQVTFTPCLVLVKPRKRWAYDRLG